VGLLYRQLLVPPAPALTVAETKQFARVTLAAEDSLIARLIEAARSSVQEITRRAIGTQTWRAYFSGWPCGGIELPFPPFRSLSSIMYRAADGSPPGALSGSLYSVIPTYAGAEAWLAQSQSWPALARHPAPVTVDWVCGYGDGGEAIPPDLKHAIALLTATFYDRRSDPASIPDAVFHLCEPHIVPAAIR
jgi:uncharacterized phiE125 gp8 family phage protein